MGWKGAVRSLGAAARAAERDARRRQKDLDRKRREYEKMQELDQAEYEVDVFENHIDVIQSVHKECEDPIDWVAIESSERPKQPDTSNEFEAAARFKADNYKAGLIDKIFKKEEKKRAYLEREVAVAIQKDKVEYESKIKCWDKKVEDWKESVLMAKALLRNDGEAKLKAIENFNSFAEISSLGSNLWFSVEESGMLEVTVHIHSADIVPGEVKSLLKSGKLSVKKMPIGRFNEIYQDYVCSCALRVANEIFSIIPDEFVIVTAVDELLNSKNGHLEETPILSAVISNSTLKSLNLDAIDPSDSMNNFVHNMSFRKTKGFEPVSRVTFNALEHA